MNEPLRWGILGTGRIARKFAGQLRQTNRAALIAVGSRSRESARHFAEELGVRAAYASYAALVADPQIDAVYVSVPNALHCRWATAALDAGKHVLCEKPLAADAAEAEAMFAAAEAAGRVLVEAFMYRCHPAVERILHMVHEGAVGRLKLIRTHFTFNRPDDEADVRYQPQLAGGSLMDVGCYCVHFARALAAAEPIAVHAFAQLHRSGVDEYAAGTLQFDGGVLSNFTCGMTVEADRTTFICGSDGYLSVNNPWISDGTFHLFKADGRETIVQKATLAPHALEAERFAAVVQDGAPAFVSKVDSLGNMKVLDELRRQVGLLPSKGASGRSE